ncbi:DNA repair protein RecN [Desulfolithobacter dissulfuricans]|uniref:DNA repair protein RecN n=1 Tax=Desulfolithobacter dissulfuricans TaxID=2795293 RepID=A0A915U612_9BACT|nr:DNA repair protein RecN [Desulfolithobacter dissulfuricans]BCO09712.1 DNA repair protein RecN [Desulfolithobacter dissulfuricans]
MLQELHIENLALIDSLHLDFSGQDTGLIVFTGETGAGKSIILQALHLLTGGRGSATWIRSNCDRAVIEACFLLGSEQQESLELLRKHGLENDGECIIRRILSRTGRSRVYVNDHLVTAKLAGRLATNLVSIASQHDHQELLSSRRHLDFLDSFGELWPERQEFASLYARWQQLARSLRILQEKEQDKEQRRDFLAFQLREIQEVDPTPGEDEELSLERDRLKSSTTLATLAAKSHELLHGRLIEHLAEIRKNMEQVASLDESARELSERITTACYEVKDLESALRDYRDTIPMDPGRLEEINGRLAALKTLQRKYGPTLEEVLEFAVRAEEELQTLDSMEQELARLEKELEVLSSELRSRAAQLTRKRQKAAASLKKAMERELSSLSFPQALFSAAVESDAENIQATGQDQVTFLFSANPGEEPKPLVKVVSGGELSRLMLAMKCLLARRDQVETVVFDEVDAGIGGKAAEAVAGKISELAGHHQVFCITHLPQIAAYATAHYLVEKQVLEGRTSTSIRMLDGDSRVLELARMLGGNSLTDQTMAFARDLIERAG